MCPSEIPTGGASRPPGHARSHVPRHRDVFPLPRLPELDAVRPGLSRVCRQRAGRRAAITQRTNDAIDSLNALWQPAGADSGPPRASAFSAGDHIFDCMSSFDPGRGAEFRPEEAARQLLGRDLGYTGSEESFELGSFDRASVALPSSADRPQSCLGMLDEEARGFIEDLEGKMLKPALGHDAGSTQPYIDPVLMRRPREYRRLIHDLWDRGLIGFSQAPLTLAGLFFVKKAKGGLRMIVDARPANEKFLAAPVMPLGGSSSWSGFSLRETESLQIAQYDVESYFYRCGIPDEVGRHFCLPAVDSKFASGLFPDGSFDPALPIYPFMKVIPMGWSWAMWFAQRIHVRAHIVAGFPRPIWCWTGSRLRSWMLSAWWRCLIVTMATSSVWTPLPWTRLVPE